MALLHLLNNGLIGLPHNNNIDMRFVRLVENLDKFNNYPQGMYLYGVIVTSLNDIFLLPPKFCNASRTMPCILEWKPSRYPKITNLKDAFFFQKECKYILYLSMLVI